MVRVGWQAAGLVVRVRARVGSLGGGVMNCHDTRGLPPSLVAGGMCQLANFSTFRLFDLLGSRKVGDLETWRGGAGCERRVAVVYRRGKASAQEGVRKCCRVWDV